MSRHVDRLLTAYVEGQLTSTQAALVRLHLAECDGCRSKLAIRERFVSDLNLALGYSPRPRQAQIEEWWRAIIAAPPPEDRQPEQHWWVPSALVPAVLTMFLLILPITMGLTRGHSNAAGLGVTAVSPYVNATNRAPTQITQTQEPLRWAARVSDSTTIPRADISAMTPATPAPVIPAPLAP